VAPRPRASCVRGSRGRTRCFLDHRWVRSRRSEDQPPGAGAAGEGETGLLERGSVEVDRRPTGGVVDDDSCPSRSTASTTCRGSRREPTYSATGDPSATASVSRSQLAHRTRPPTARARDHGGVPSLRGHGTCHRPTPSRGDTSARWASSTAAGSWPRTDAAYAASTTIRQPTTVVAPQDHRSGCRSPASTRTASLTGASAVAAPRRPARPRAGSPRRTPSQPPRPRPAAGRASRPGPGAPGPAAACGARAGRAAAAART